jgi:ATP-dependent DNA helicase RecG
MLELSTPVNAISGIGPKYKKMLENLEIFTVRDLLYHFPFRYDDFSQVSKVKDLEEGEQTTVRGLLGKVQNIYTRNGKRLTRSTVTDETGTLELIWFNSHFLKRVLKTNKKYSFSGKVGSFSNKLTMLAPTFELEGENSLDTGRLVPIYPETSGISSRWLRSKIYHTLKNKVTLDEFLPKEILENESAPQLKKALWQFHFPDALTEAEKAKKRFQLEELFLELLNVERRKQSWENNLKAFSLMSQKYDHKIIELIENLPFSLTTSQKQAWEEIKDDLKEKTPMNRLLEGDVGTGKTVVAIISAYLTYLNGFCTLYMAPTEILAKQHYETFKKILKPFNVELNLLTSGTKTEISKTPHITIGTHALLFKEKIAKVGLIIIDEQHRFGVEQRTKLTIINEDRCSPHLLTMTATPIPRTLALTVYGDLQISKIEPIPEKEKRVTTKIVPEKAREKAFQWIKQSGEQTFIVCPFIEESEHEDFENVKAAKAEYQKLKKGIFKDLRLGLLHGRMKSQEKREVVEKFESGEIQVLISTPVIEVGIDIPDAAIIVIESAERYGLASLHQLRGRVGRGEKPGTCFVFMSNNSRDSFHRLKYLEKFNDGLQLAEIDMEMRGHGDIYGTAQHGFKHFKVARLSDMEMLEKAKSYAKEYFPRLNEFPQLQENLDVATGRYVGAN